MSILAVLFVTFYAVVLLNMWRLTFIVIGKWWRVRHSKDAVKRSFALEEMMKCIGMTVLATVFFGSILYENL